MPASFSTYGFANQMGPRLRQLVEEQLMKDLQHYGISSQKMRFDWSESCIEGHAANYLDGSLENFSSISLYDEHNNVIADGWMEFILVG